MKKQEWRRKRTSCVEQWEEIQLITNMGVTWLSVIFILDDVLLIKLPNEQARLWEKTVLKLFFYLSYTEDRENHHEILSYGSFSSQTMLDLNWGN